MVITYRRPGVYLEESLLINPSDTAGTVTVAAFIGVAGKGPINDPILCESWSAFVTTFGDFSPIPSPTPIDPNDVTLSAIGSTPPETLALLQTNTTYGDGWFVGADMTAGQFVKLGNDSLAHYTLPALATAKGTVAPNSRYANEATVTASDATNAAKLTALGYIASPTSAWTAGQSFWLENGAATGADYAFYWTGTAWAAGTSGANPAKSNNGAWSSGKVAGTGVAVPAPVPVLSYLPYSVFSFFQNGGRFAWVIRSVDPIQSGEYSSIDVNGASATGDLQSFKLAARSVGSWGDRIKYQLVHNLPLVGEDAVFSMRIILTNSRGVDETVENWTALSVRGIPGTKRIDAALNDPASGSQYVRVLDLNSAQPQPAEAEEATALTGGVDPNIPQGQDMVASAIDGVSRLEGPVTVNIAGYLNDANKAEGNDAWQSWVGTTVSAASFPDRQDIFIVNDSAPPRSPNIPSSVYKSQMQGPLLADAGVSYSASYGPWIIVPNPTVVGRTIGIPPGGSVMGMMARIDSTVGVFRAPAGVIAGLNNAVGVQAKFTDSELGDLNYQNINVIRSVVGAGICVMGGRTRKSYGTDRYISARRTLIYIKEVMRRSTQFAVFENNDQRLWSALRMSAERVLRPLWEAGGLRGESAAQAYFIRCDSTINTLAVISSGEVRMELGVALEYPAEFVIIRVTQFDQGTFTTEVQPAA